MRRARCSGWVPRWCRPHETSDVVVSRPPATRFHMIAVISSSARGRPPITAVTRAVVTSSDGLALRKGREAGQLGPHVVAAGHRAAEPCVGGLIRRGGVEEVGVVLPIGRLHAHQLEGQDRRDRGGVVEHQVRGAGLDDLVEEPGRHRLHPRPLALDDPGRHVGVEHPAQLGVLGAVDLRHPHAGHVRRPGYAADAAIGDPVVSVGLVLVGEGLVVAGHGRHRLVVGHHPEPAVMLVEHHRAAVPHLGVAAVAAGDEVGSLMIDVDGAAGQVLHRPSNHSVRPERGLSRICSSRVSLARRRFGDLLTLRCRDGVRIEPPRRCNRGCKDARRGSLG